MGVHRKAFLRTKFEGFVDAVLEERIPIRLVEAEVCLATDERAARLLVTKPDNQSIASDLRALRELHGHHATRAPFLKNMILFVSNKRIKLTLHGLSGADVVLTYPSGDLDDHGKMELEQRMGAHSDLALMRNINNVDAPLDDWSGLLGREGGFPLPNPGREAALATLVARSLVEANDYEYVRCSYPDDPDFKSAIDPCCIGLVMLRSGDARGRARCANCGRSLLIDEKRVLKGVQVTRNLDRCGLYVRSLLEKTNRPVREHTKGIFRIETDLDEVHVYFVDVCSTWRALQSPAPDAIYIVASDLDWTHRLPKGFPVFRLVDLVLGSHTEFLSLLQKRLETSTLSSPSRHRVSYVTSPASCARETKTMASSREPISLPFPEGAQWKDVVFYQLDGERVSLRVLGGEAKPYLYADLGFASSKNREAVKGWRILIALCEGRGTCMWRDLGYAKFSSFTTEVARLRVHLRILFRIGEDPFVSCSQRSGLRSRFVALPEPPGAEARVDYRVGLTDPVE